MNFPGIQRQSDGTYKVRVTVGYRYDPKAKRNKAVRRKRSGIRSFAEAKKVRTELLSESVSQSDPTTVAEFIEQWLENDVRHRLKPNTVASYQQQVTYHIVPRIGNVPLADLSPSRVNMFAAEMRADKVPIPTQSYVLRVLSQICKRALQLELMTRNPVTAVKRPSVKKKAIQPFTLEESKAIMLEMKGMPNGAAYCLGLLHGMRVGEIFGLHWSDIDFDNKSISVKHNLVYGAGPLQIRETKTEAGTRVIQLTQPAIDELHERRRLAMAAGQASNPLVLCTDRGNKVRPPVWWRDEWSPLLKKLGIAHRGFHHTRHTYATLALSAGVPLTVVSKVLGHANPKITLEIYAHCLPDDQLKSVDAMERLHA